MKNAFLFLLVIAFLASCNNTEELPNAYGNFEANEIIVSAEGTGKLLEFDIKEGDLLTKEQQLGLIDTTDLYLKKVELKAAIRSINAKTKNIKPEIDVLEEQLSNLKREKDRFTKMKEGGAATEKQLDDINGQIDVVQKQIEAVKSNLSTANRGLLAEIPTMEAKMMQIENAIEKSIIKSPETGTVLAKYAEENEFTAMGKPLFKMANLTELELRIYISETQLAEVKIGEEVKVSVDYGEGMKDYKGTISWISGKAEFTPKIIQTKEERKNLVYASKIIVKNDGSLKIGMPAEVYFE